MRRPRSQHLTRQVLAAAALSLTVAVGWLAIERDHSAAQTAPATYHGVAAPGDVVAAFTPRNGIVAQGTGIVGVLPASGFALITYGGTIEELRDGLAIVCASGSPVYTTSAGQFFAFFPTTALVKPNAVFTSLFPGGNIPDHTPLMGGNCGPPG